MKPNVSCHLHCHRSQTHAISGPDYPACTVCTCT